MAKFDDEFLARMASPNPIIVFKRQVGEYVHFHLVEAQPSDSFYSETGGEVAIAEEGLAVQKVTTIATIPAKSWVVAAQNIPIAQYSQKAKRIAWILKQIARFA